MAMVQRIRSASSFPLFRSARSVSTVVQAVPDVRQLALPVAFVSVKGWDGDEGMASWKCWSKRLSKAGYSSTMVELDAPAQGQKSEEVLASLESELTKELSGASSSYPPLLISSGLSTLVAQQYVSSHPLSGLLLVNPIPEGDAQTKAPETFSTPVPEFTFEPEFPVGVMVESEEALESAGERLLVEFGEPAGGEVRALIGGKDAEGFQVAMNWMDENSL